LFTANGAVRGVMHAANAVSLAEDVDERRMSRGMASSVLSMGQDLGGIASPMLCGFVASAIGLAGMFLLVPPTIFAAAMGIIGGLTWHSRRAAQPALKLTH
jgi:hypothetical protein